MSSEPRDRASLLLALEQELARLAAEEGAHRQALAERLGLHPTDLRCVELLARQGPLGAGQMAEALGLTTGAITGVVDRLERGAWVRRGRSESDRRAVILELAPARREELRALLEAPAGALAERVAAHTAKELGLLVDFVADTATWLAEAAGRLQSEGSRAGEAAASSGFTAPLGEVRQARLEFTAGASGVRLTADRKLGALYRAEFEGRQPAARVESGTVTLRYPRFSLFDWRKLAARVVLNATIPWELAFRGGASRVDADLRNLPLRAFEVGGGASELTVSLPEPHGIVPLRVVGGASQLVLRRPKGSAVRLDVRGGISELVFDAQQLGSVGGRLRLESANASHAEDRYELELTGGASNLTVVEL